MPVVQVSRRLIVSHGAAGYARRTGHPAPQTEERQNREALALRVYESPAYAAVNSLRALSRTGWSAQRFGSANPVSRRDFRVA